MMQPDDDHLSHHDEALWTEISTAVQETHRDDLRRAVRQSIDTVRANARKQRNRRLLYIGLALLTAGLVAAYYFFRQPSPQQWAAQYFDPEFDVSIQRSAAAADSLQWYFKQAQETGDFTVMRLWLQTHRPAEISSAYTLNLAQIWLLSDQPDSTLVLLSSIDHQSSFKKDWLTALAHLMAGHQQDADLLLQRIAQSTGPYQSRARDLLREINR